ncbi:hypothetical protein BCR32DRAFT_245361 [Anaeromyces robustus]|uniref:Uncharacterized protein n=1 Tax=Anaeromyces robustus TaxID=1754192 RepID=A0A1Y1X563_9FUNG|nr:hypothetical protein BCR32DRAFT_245361 [Anaeromyces robustus]|eukprot:ORX80785.1 hypothetical protein BCR32DRAFT_245361 [Anaeromyces robustus]
MIIVFVKVLVVTLSVAIPVYKVIKTAKSPTISHSECEIFARDICFKSDAFFCETYPEYRLRHPAESSAKKRKGSKDVDVFLNDEGYELYLMDCYAFGTSHVSYVTFTTEIESSFIHETFTTEIYSETTTTAVEDIFTYKSENEIPTETIKSVNEIPTETIKSVNEIPTETIKSENEIPTETIKSENEIPTETIKSVNEIPTETIKSENEIPTETIKSENEIPTETIIQFIEAN